MKRRWIALSVTLAAAAALLVSAEAERRASTVAAGTSLKLRYLAAGGRVRALGGLAADFDISPQGDLVMIPESGGLAMLDAVGAPTIYPMDGRHFQSIAFDERDTMLGVSKGYLGRLAGEAGFEESVPLPYNDARIARSVHPGSLYLFGGYAGEWRLYQFWEDGRFEILLRSPLPIIGVADSLEETYVATPRRIFRIGKDGLNVAFVAPADPEWGPVTSLAVTPAGELLFATPGEVWAATRDGRAGTVINNAGDQLRWRGAGIYVLDRSRGLALFFEPRRWPQ